MTTTAAANSTPAVAEHPARSALMVAALGVVFGDIGTSPIYAFRKSLKAAGGNPHSAVLGVVSLMIWAVTLIVAIKYVVFVMRADNQGEGGTMALLSLALPAAGRLRNMLLPIGLAGASLFFGDAMITPAISVLSAVEGLNVITPLFDPYSPAAAVILVGLFAVQSRGSGHVGRFFGPVMALWFLVLAGAGVAHVFQRPDILAALDPRHALFYLTHADAWYAFTVLGSVFLALTGGEALYADMGHFGRSSIRIDWFALVMPALVLNYLGQGALVLNAMAAASNPLLPPVPGVVARSRRRADDGRHHHRKPSGDFRSVRSRPASNSARRAAAARRAPDLGQVGGTGLRPADQLDARHRNTRARFWLLPAGPAKDQRRGLRFRCGSANASRSSREGGRQNWLKRITETRCSTIAGRFGNS